MTTSTISSTEDGVSDDVLFVVVIVLIVSVGIAYSINGSTTVNEQEQHLPFILRKRILSWMKKVFTLVNGFSSILGLCSISSSVISKVASSLFMVSLSCVLSADSIRNLPFMKKKLIWMVSYVMVCVYCGIKYVSFPEWFTFVSFLSSILSLTFAVMCAVLDLKSMQINPPNAEYTSDLFSYMTFSYLNNILIQPARIKKVLQYEDVPKFVDADSSEQIWDRFRLILSSYKNQISLPYSLLKLVQYEWQTAGMFQFIASCSLYGAPLALERILLHIGNNGRDDDEAKSLFPISISMAVVILFAGPVLKSVGDSQNYMRGRHMGVRVKSALISSIFSKAMTVDLAGSKESIGKLNNLISVDVTAVQEFFCYTHYVWATPMEICISSYLLYMVLGNAALGGILLMVLCLYVGFRIQKRLEHYQNQMLVNKDLRMGIINEVLNSIRIIKLFAWEMKFMQKISSARDLELTCLRNYSLCQCATIIIWELVPSLVGMSAFIVHTQLLGKELSPATGFTAIALFNLLSSPLMMFPEIINSVVRSNVSLMRIKSFLDSDDVKGLGDSKSSSKDYSSPTEKLQSKSTDASRVDGYVEMSHVTLAWPPVQKDEVASLEGFRSGSVSKWCADFSQRYLVPCCSSIGQRHAEYMSCCPSTNVDKSTLLMRNNTFGGSSNSKSAVKYKPVNGGSGGAGADNGVENTGSNSPFTIADDENLEETGGNGDNDVEDCGASNLYGSIVLDDVCLRVSAGSLAVVVGMTGSGKSTLLQGGFLGECKHLGGQTTLNGSVSYVSQSAWIQNASLRDNILFGSPFEKDRYDKVLFACALLSDLKLLPAGDLTEIGEKGVNLSGGQQQRVSLARAAYAKSSIILMDDPLSAVDTHVGEHIFRELVVGFLSDRTRVLVSHNLSLAVPAADTVICIDHSYHKVAACCAPSELTAQLRGNKSLYTAKGKLGSFWEGLLSIIANNNASSSAVSSNGQPAQSSSTATDSSVNFESEGSAKDQQCSFKIGTTGGSASPPPPPTRTQRGESIDNILLTNNTNCSGSSMASPSVVAIPAPSVAGNIVSEETRSAGDISWTIYWFYLKAGGGLLAFVVMVTACISISVSQLFMNYRLGIWMSDMESSSPDTSVAFWIYLSSLLSVLLSVLVKLGAMLVISLFAAQKLHHQLIRSVILAPTSWFDATPVGRIVNRFSQDISTVDSNVTMNLMMFITNVLGAAQIVVVISSCLPLLLLPFIPIIAFTVWVAYQYLMVSRELKRLESLKKSPVFILFSESLAGLSVIRSFRHESRFFKLCCKRVDEMNQCHMYLWLCNRWLNFRMQLLGALVAGSVGLAVIVYEDHINSTVAAIVIIYSMSFCDYLTWLARSHADCQMDMNSVERLQEYSSLQPENYREELDENDGSNGNGSGNNSNGASSSGDMMNEEFVSDGVGRGARSSFGLKAMAKNTLFSFGSGNANSYAPLSSDIEMGRQHSSKSAGSGKVQGRARGSWPLEGKVEFRNVAMKYNSSATPVLRNISFTIPGRMKVGVVGRTGAGKSSLIAALFRLVEPHAGEILIDGVNTLNLPLHALRNEISIVPQDPTLFKGSVRFNLDPFNQHSDEELWAALRSVHLADHVQSMENDVLPVEDAAQDIQATGSTARNWISGSLSRSNSTSSISSTTSELERKSVAEKGGNFSVGQRQLLCMARAILRNAAVLVLDECTASVDHETDSLIQETVRNDLLSTTVICIAHRLRTIAYYDLVLVMDQGAVAEFAHPYLLMSDDKSVFKNMCIASGEYDDLLNTARAAYENQLSNHASV